MFSFIQGLLFSFSDELYSQLFYKQLNELENFSSYISKCEELSSFQKDNRVKKVCARLLKYLESDAISRNKNNRYDVCMLLSFWVYSKLFDSLKNKDANTLRQAYGKLQPIWTDFIDKELEKTEDQTCRPIHNLALHNDWRERKELYEYFVDYSPIKEIVDKYGKICNEFYVYVQNKARLYKHFESLCPDKNPNKCPEFYAQCKQYDPEKVLPRLDCYHEIKQERDAAALSIPQLRDEHSVNEPNSEGTDAGMKPFDDPNLSGNPHTVTKLGNVFLGVVATSMTSGALYRVNINSLIQTIAYIC
ncbi:hypothetical protein PVBG_05585 [Plasmodium vivax Brazil I]|uniref:Variable surface protein Vir4 n=1 Tax=Plasmodium vivax (strain Brazil I) TaxID=1033975 RepID=A0A0J9VBF2_PLAV1|nr:hypothetical protein PVBG_05585 [Plasmodium vivax Brazil I]